VEIKAGLKIFNKNKRINHEGEIIYGTLGGIVYDSNTKQKLIITCFHSVMAEGTTPKAWKKNNTVCTIINGEIIEIGNIIDAKLNDEVDIAIIKPYNNFKLNTDIHNKGTHRNYINTHNLNKGITRVWKYGANTHYKIGKYIGVDNSEEIDYANIGKHEIQGLLKVENVGDSNFALGGDSGSLVFDFDRHVIGILAAKNIENCFIIRAFNIIANFNIKFVK